MENRHNLSKQIKRLLQAEKLKENDVGVLYHYGSTVTGYELKFSEIDL